uniref:Urumin n=1 Tax=Hydrophylax bahuvistara TaxID=1690667 RepID=URUM_HYDBH|nr:RecName: Full=Urumin; AltName: Full=Host defense peptide; Short=HDP [Hydrophylax bahuvistara]
IPLRGAFINGRWDSQCHRFSNGAIACA